MPEKIFSERCNRNFLYGNVEIQSVCPDEAEGKLTLWVVYAGREVQEVIYHGVYASQISPSLAGRRISLVEEVPLSILNDSRYAAAARQLFSFRDGATPEFISLAERRGNKLYLHYISQQSEYMVVARKVQILSLGTKWLGEES